MRKRMRLKIIAILVTAHVFVLQAKSKVLGCEAYNNMKHTVNTHNVLLDRNSQYRTVRMHKGQYLVVIKDAKPAQRWVDSKCLDNISKENRTYSYSNTKKYYKNTIANSRANKRAKNNQSPQSETLKRSKQNLLVISWHNAFCQTHRSKKECKQEIPSTGRLSLHGLWPQPKNNAYCNVPKKIVARDKYHQWEKLPDLDLRKSTIELMDYMPGYVSGLHKHEWIKHGTCYGKSADSYYSDALKFTKEIDESKVGDLFRNNIGKRLTLDDIKKSFEETFGRGAGDSVVLKCKKGLISELWISLKGKDGRLKEILDKTKIKRSRCGAGTVDAKGF